MIKTYKEKGKYLKWSIKITKFVTHLYKFDRETIGIFLNFRVTFDTMEEKITFYLFQLPPSMKPDFKNKKRKIYKKT